IASSRPGATPRPSTAGSTGTSGRARWPHPNPTDQNPADAQPPPVGCVRMCGIVGVAGSDRGLLERMLPAVVHRGPDGQGMDVGRHVSIGMRRLAIIDVATGDQPLYSDDGNLALVFNGEIYNHVELRRELQQRGRKFVTDHSDTEVILRGFEE